jgi:hypothetical protein
MTTPDLFSRTNSGTNLIQNGVTINMKFRVSLGIAAGLVLVASGLAHGIAGWPGLGAALNAAGMDQNTVGAIAAGWYFGSVAMLTFGVIVLSMTWKILRGQSPEMCSAGIISIAYILFGVVAFVLRDYNLHFLVFIGTGVLMGVFALSTRA